MQCVCRPDAGGGVLYFKGFQQIHCAGRERVFCYSEPSFHRLFHPLTAKRSESPRSRRHNRGGDDFRNARRIAVASRVLGIDRSERDDLVRRQRARRRSNGASDECRHERSRERLENTAHPIMVRALRPMDCLRSTRHGARQGTTAIGWVTGGSDIARLIGRTCTSRATRSTRPDSRAGVC